MSSAKVWEVWSVDVAKDRGLVVDEGTEQQAKSSMIAKNDAAKRQGMRDLVFLALPRGKQPSMEAAREILAERLAVLDVPPAEPVAGAPHDRWVAQSRKRLVEKLGEDRVSEWESVLDDHRLPDGHLPDYQVLLLMDVAFHQGAFREQVRAREAQREGSR